MSRTDKDRPYRVRVNDPSEAKDRSHRHTSFGARGTNFLGEEYGYADHCTIDEPTLHRSNRDPLNRPPCEAHLAFQYRPGSRPKPKDVRDAYWSPARQAERSALQSMAAEFNATGTIENEPTMPEQHRGSMYGGGWWD